MGRPSNKEKRRKEITDALLVVMARDGYSKASIQVIAEEAGLASGLIHHHFKNKQEILLNLITEIEHLIKKRFDHMLEESVGPLGRIEALIDAKLAKGKSEHPEIVKAWVAIGAEAVNQKEVREFYQKIILDDMEFIKNELKPFVESDKKRQDISAGIVACMEGAFQLSSAAVDIMPSGYAAEMTKLLLRNSV